MKKLLIISEVYKKGGAGNATYNLFNYFTENNFQTRLIVPFYKGTNKNIISYFNHFTYLKFLILKLFFRLISKIFTRNKFFFFNNIFNNSLFTLKNIKKKIRYFNPDYVIVFWYEYILNYSLILKIKLELNVKIILFPFDMYLFTGGCRYTQSCNNYLNQCKNCPAITLTRPANINFLKNKYLIKKIDPIILFPSIFSKNFSINSSILNSKIKKFIFYYPVSISKSNTFSNNEIIKKIINKKREGYKKIIFIGTQNSNEWRKGIFNIKNFLDIYESKYKKNFESILFIYLGSDNKLFFKGKKNFILYDFLSYNDYISILNLCDAVIVPSLQEWSSLILSEAFYLNKFIFSFNTGSSFDLVQDSHNGYIFNYYDTGNFCNKLNLFLYENLKLIKKKTLSHNNFIKLKLIKQNNKIIKYLNKR